MSHKLPRIDPDKMIRILLKLGFSLARTSGSHRIYKSGEKRVVIPYHSGKLLHPEIVKSIIKELGLTEKEFVKLIR